MNYSQSGLMLVGDKPQKNANAGKPDALEIARRHPAYIPGLPIGQQPVEVEELWWAAIFAERGIPDPMEVECKKLTNG